MLIAAGLATAFLTLLLVFVLLRSPRSATGERTDAADLTPEGQEHEDQQQCEPGEDLPDQIETDSPDSMEVRVLRAQVVTLEQALEQADAETAIARIQAEEARQAAEDVAHRPTPVPLVPPAQVPLVPPAQIREEPPAQVPLAPPAQVPLDSPTLIQQVPAPPSEPDVVLPVPPPAEPEARRGNRWFRRSAA